MFEEYMLIAFFAFAALSMILTFMIKSAKKADKPLVNNTFEVSADLVRRQLAAKIARTVYARNSHFADFSHFTIRPHIEHGEKWWAVEAQYRKNMFSASQTNRPPQLFDMLKTDRATALGYADGLNKKIKAVNKCRTEFRDKIFAWLNEDNMAQLDTWPLPNAEKVTEITAINPIFPE